MPCLSAKFPGGLVITCTKKSKRRVQCSTPGCKRTAVALCDYPITREGKPSTCDRALCDRCRHPQQREWIGLILEAVVADKFDFCRVHHEMAREARLLRGKEA